MAFTALTAIALGAAAIGTGVSLYGQSQQTAAMQRSENARQQQLNLESMRRRREIIRNAVVARSAATFSASTQGAMYGSGLPGGQGQVYGEAGRQTGAVNQNEELGGRVFGANQDYYNASGFTTFGTALTSLGGQILNNAGTIERVGTYVGAGGR